MKIINFRIICENYKNRNKIVVSNEVEVLIWITNKDQKSVFNEILIVVV